MSGGTVRVEGIARDVRIAGGHVLLGADVTGPVEVVAERIEILPGARLRGPLTYRSPEEAAIAPGALLEGPVTFKRVDRREARQARARRGVSSLLFGLHVLITGLLVIVLVPRATLDVAATLQRQPGGGAHDCRGLEEREGNGIPWRGGKNLPREACHEDGSHHGLDSQDGAPTRITATPPDSLASRSWSFSRS